MEPDYRNHRPRRVAISTRHRIIAATGLVVVAFLVTSTIQIGVKNRARQTDVVKATKVGLIEQIQRADDRRGSLFVEVSAMSVAIDLLQRRNLQLSAQGVELAKKIDNALTYSGDRAVVGEGIVIRLDEIEKIDENDFKERKPEILKMVFERNNAVFSQAFIASLFRTATIKVNDSISRVKD